MVAKLFSKVGKDAGDLFKKMYDYKYEVATKSSGESVKLETGAVGKDNALNGYGKINYSDKAFGKVDVEMRTKDRPAATNVKLTLNKLSPGLEVVAKADASSSGSLEATYAQDFFSLQSLLSSNGSKHGLSASGLITSDGLSCGGAVKVGFADDGPELKDYNVGAEYSEGPITLSLVTKQQGEAIEASYFQKLSKATRIGSTFSHSPENDTRTLKFGGHHQFDAATVIKSKVGTCGTVAVAVEHRLASPSVLVGVAASFNALSKEPLVAQDFGVSLKFGEF